MREAAVKSVGGNRKCLTFFLMAVFLMTFTVSVAQAQITPWKESYVFGWYWTAEDDIRSYQELYNYTGGKVTTQTMDLAGSYGEVYAEAFYPDYGLHRVKVRSDAAQDVACAISQGWTYGLDAWRFERSSAEAGSEGIVSICYAIDGFATIEPDFYLNVQFIATMDSSWGYEEIAEIYEDYTYGWYIRKAVCGRAHYVIGEDMEYYESFFVEASPWSGCSRNEEVVGYAEGDFSGTVRMVSVTPSPGHYLAWTASGATYPPKVPPTLTVTKQGNGTGAVTSDPPGIDCGADCTESYDNGKVVTLTANPDPGSVFAGWSVDGGCPVPGNHQFTLTKNTTITAIFINTENFTRVTMVFPNGGEALHPDQECTAIFGGPSTVESYKLFHSFDKGATWKPVTTEPVTGNSILWTVPPVKKNTASCLTKVVGYKGTTKVGSDKSDKPFTIEVLKLDYPNGDEFFTSGQDVTITWSTHAPTRPVNKVKLSYTLDNGTTWKAFASQPPIGSDPGSHTVQLPTVTRTKSKCKVKVVLKDNNNVTVGSDVSNGAFSILNP
jgi:hypothetical protein